MTDLLETPFALEQYCISLFRVGTCRTSESGVATSLSPGVASVRHIQIAWTWIWPRMLRAAPQSILGHPKKATVAPTCHS